MFDVVYSDDHKQYVAVGNGEYVGDKPLIIVSNDGMNWTVVADHGLDNNETKLLAVAYGNGVYVAVGEDFFAWSADGLDWHSVPGTFGGLDGGGDPIYDALEVDELWDVAYGDDGFFAIGTVHGPKFGTIVYASTDGQTWTVQGGTTDNGVHQDLFAITSNGATYVAVGDSMDGGVVMIWRNGMPEWEQVFVLQNYFLEDVAWGNADGFMAVGGGGPNLEPESIYVMSPTGDNGSWQHDLTDVSHWFELGQVTHGASGFAVVAYANDAADSPGGADDNDAIYLAGKKARPRPRLPIIAPQPPPPKPPECPLSLAPESGPLTRAEYVLVMELGASDFAHPFVDIDGHELEPCIARATEVGAVIGYPQSFYRPDQPIILEEAVAVLRRWANVTLPDGEDEADRDTRVSAWARPDWAWAVASEVIDADADPTETVDLARALELPAAVQEAVQRSEATEQDSNEDG